MSLRLQEQDGVAVLALDRAPANAFRPDFIREIRAALSQISQAGAVVLTSTLPTIFSAGWDLPVLISLGRAEMSDFVGEYCDLVRQLFVFPTPVVAALPGHAVAGGLIFAAAADERLIAAGRGQLGLSEVALGVPLPRCLYEIFRHGIGPRAAERLAASGENLAVDAAFRIGLVDRVVQPDALAEESLSRARFLATRSRPAHAAIKAYARAEALVRFDAARRNDPFLDSWFGPEAQRRIGELVEKLKKN
jgi:Delta3-Delta2-enoyl-CoA isomerase